jgi:manganese transport protein
MPQKQPKSLEEVHSSVDTMQKKGFFKKLLAFMGPAYLISVGYMDPGNWATDLAGGSQFGYTLIWVLLMSNIMAVLLQSLSTRLGIVYGRDLAQACREGYPPVVNYALYFLAEIAIIATDLAEVIGMAIGLNLLFDIPLIWGIILTFLDTFILLFLINKGMRKMEAFILALVFIIGMSFLVEMFLAKPQIGEIMEGFIPSIPNKDALYIALGIIGATVMPHNLYLHSSLVQTRKFGKSIKSIKEALKFNLIDSVIALNLAFFVNAAILVLAAATFYKAGLYEVAEIQDAYKLLEPLLGSHLAPILFAIALIAAGQSSTITGTLAGQIIMEGFINFRIQPWMRRMITRLLAILPAIAVIMIYGVSYTGKLLIFSQVILSLQLGFAVIPLIHFVSDKKLMGDFVISLKTKLAAWVITIIIVVLNALLVIDEIQGWIKDDIGLWAIILVFIMLSAIVVLLLYITFTPWIKSLQTKTLKLHAQEDIIPDFEAPEYKRIAIALDFSPIDQKVLKHALALGKPGSKYLLIHIVESASAIYHGKNTADYETLKDKEVLERYAKRLRDLGYDVETKVGYGNPKVAIPKIVNKFKADVLVFGSHGHKWLKDLIFGTTINTVRHNINIPILVVRE